MRSVSPVIHLESSAANMAMRTKQVYEFPADQTCAAKDDYFHILIFWLSLS
jgi:hypothetical protein